MLEELLGEAPSFRLQELWPNFLPAELWVQAPLTSLLEAPGP